MKLRDVILAATVGPGGAARIYVGVPGTERGRRKPLMFRVSAVLKTFGLIER
jgi:hypothetical protein